MPTKDHGADSKPANMGWQFMECQVCAARDEQPKLLDCNHAICEQCLNVATPASSKTITCPTCFEQTRIPKGGIYKLKSSTTGFVEEAALLLDEEMGPDEVITQRCVCDGADTAFMDCQNCGEDYQQMEVRRRGRNVKTADKNINNGRINRGGMNAEIHSTRDVENIDPKRRRQGSVKRREAMNRCGELVFRMLEDCLCVGDDDNSEDDDEAYAGHPQCLNSDGDAEEKEEMSTWLERMRGEVSSLASCMMAPCSDNTLRQRERLRLLSDIAELPEHNIDNLDTNLERESNLDNDVERNTKSRLKCLDEDDEMDTATHTSSFTSTESPLDNENNESNTLSKSRRSFTALVHLSDPNGENNEQLLSVHGLLGRVLHELCEKQQSGDETNRSSIRQSRPISISEYVMFMKRVCEEDPTLGRLENNVKERWTLHKTLDVAEQTCGTIQSATVVAASPNGDFVVVDAVSRKVVVFDESGNYKLTLDNPPVCASSSRDRLYARPRGIAVNSCGEYYVVDGTKSVKVFNSNGRFKRTFGTNAENSRPTCIAVDTNDRVLLGDKNAMMLTLHTPEGVLIRRIKIYAKPNFLAVNTKGDIFISDHGTGRVYAIDAQGTPIFTMDTVIEGIRYKAMGICCDVTDEIYIALHSGNEKGTYAVCRFSSRGKLLGRVANDLWNPVGLCFTPLEKLMVADDSSVKQYIMR